MKQTKENMCQVGPIAGSAWTSEGSLEANDGELITSELLTDEEPRTRHAEMLVRRRSFARWREIDPFTIFEREIHDDPVDFDVGIHVSIHISIHVSTYVDINIDVAFGMEK